MHRNISCNFCYIPRNNAESTPPVLFLAGIGKRKEKAATLSFYPILISIYFMIMFTKILQSISKVKLFFLFFRNFRLKNLLQFVKWCNFPND